MSYGNHTDCGLCRGHSVNCWCALWPAEVKQTGAAWCHEPDEHARLVQPGGILTMPRALSDEEYERIARRWRWAIKADGNAQRIINADGTYGRWTGRRPPWWKRAYYQVRRWLA